ncbi:MAG: N-acetylmuramoyl-L-alanine amidase, partial [Fischerella sp.]|nr:N-acetylmuramoyl-L-alanine amidase [Fischerella sp.]
PILRVRLQQQDPRAVAIFVQPAAGVQIGQLNKPSPELLSLELRRSFGRLRPPVVLPGPSGRSRPPVVTLPLPRPNPRPLS